MKRLYQIEAIKNQGNRIIDTTAIRNDFWFHTYNEALQCLSVLEKNNYFRKFNKLWIVEYEYENEIDAILEGHTLIENNRYIKYSIILEKIFK